MILPSRSLCKCSEVQSMEILLPFYFRFTSILHSILGKTLGILLNVYLIFTQYLLQYFQFNPWTAPVVLILRLSATFVLGAGGTLNLTQTHSKLTQNGHKIYRGFPLIRGGFAGSGWGETGYFRTALLDLKSTAENHLENELIVLYKKKVNVQQR